ncbi:hypothetical protein G7051_17570 [Dysgonomonas sp. HDW5B]|uniref:DUF6712 family protein n=1 Tax=Dysgonomonas sp. HDW5B TaxID=2714927 RepID=UPI00140DE571|nr:hypothetical protein [Dysgonomonas sp. HDW5B]QIK56070.1 hypothetical protein G7051_17570 [Dysgonomonas sp. HDW5B]
MKLPFEKATFAREMKPRISGVNITLEYDNIESSLCKVAVTCAGILSQKLYDKICGGNASSDQDLQDKAKDYLQRAMLHFGIYEHLIFLITRIGNDGVTVKKNEDETTIYKYQEDALNNNLITTGWFWMNQLLRLLNDNKAKFEDWKGNEEMSEIPIDVTDFQRWVGVSDEYFIIVARWLIREVWEECILSREKVPEKNKFNTRALCYDVMARACTRLAYMSLPEPIRRDISNEMGKNHNAKADDYIRERVAKTFEAKAITYWTAWDLELKKQDVKAGKTTMSNRPVIGERNITDRDKFYFG